MLEQTHTTGGTDFTIINNLLTGKGNPGGRRGFALITVGTRCWILDLM
jgi:hypothetical protein